MEQREKVLLMKSKFHVKVISELSQAIHGSHRVSRKFILNNLSIVIKGWSHFYWVSPHKT